MLVLAYQLPIFNVAMQTKKGLKMLTHFVVCLCVTVCGCVP